MAHTVAFLGLGAMGRLMAGRLIAAGLNVVVWNRTASAADTLLAKGAKWAESPKVAAEQADFVVSMVRDNEASKEVWLNPEQGALFGLPAHAVAIESSTITVNWVKELATHFVQQQRAFLEAPVSGSLPQAEAGVLAFLPAGNNDDLAKARAVLQHMGKVPEKVIGAVGNGALAKLSTNTLMGAEVAAMAEIIAMLRRHKADEESIIEVLRTTTAWSTVTQMAAQSILNNNFSPLFPVELLRKDFAYMMELVSDKNLAPVLSATEQQFDQAIGQGLGHEQMTAIVKLLD